MVKKIAIKIFHIICQIVYRVSGWFVKDNRIYFESFHGKQYSDSPRAIYEYMKKNHPEYELIWGVKKGFESIFIEEDVPYVHRLTLQGMYLMGSSKHWVINTRMPDWMIKSKKTTYIQTWHGTPLKKLGLDIENVKMPGISTTEYRNNFSKETARWDYLISANSYSSQIFKRAFNFPNTMLESGYPRNDDLLNITDTEYLKGKLKIDASKKIILYAPTWRDNQFYKQGSYKFELPFSITDFTKKFGEDAVLLIRMHYLVSESLDFSQFDGKVLDVSTYPDMRELLLVSDLLITDYSSSFFDYALRNQPILFYMFDKKEYEDVTRGMYFDVKDRLPWPIVEREKELFNYISSFLKGSNRINEEKLVQFKTDFNDFEKGTACQQVADIITKK